MSGIGSILGAFGQAYPQYQQQQQGQQMNQLKIQQALQQMAQEKQSREAQGRALNSFGTLQPQGPSGVITPQQIAAISQGNPEAFNMMQSATRPTNTGLFQLDRTQMQGDNRMNQIQAQGDNRMDAVTAQQEGANSRNAASNASRTNNVQVQQDNANKRNENTVASRKSSVANPVNIALLPEYRTAKTEYEEAKKDERNIIAHYPSIAQAYNDPQWLDARKRSLDAQKKMESIQSKSAKSSTPSAEPVKIATDDDYNKLASGTQFLDPEGNLRTKP